MPAELEQHIHSLNPQQKQAVQHQKGPMLVLAGAGSGKTKVATLRIAHLLRSGIEASNILGLTFTNKAAKEMKERVEKYASHSVLVCTFHSLGARILRESIHHLGYGRDFLIYDEDDTDRLLKESARELGVAQAIDLKSIRAFISAAKNGLSPSTSEDDEASLALYERYLQKQKQCNSLDFDDLLFLPVQLFRQFPEVLAYYQSRWTHLLVDEYQDTNVAQYTFVKLLSGTSCNLFVVGDPDQSIYSWRGANIRNILSFENDFPGAQIIKLEQNYRSTSTILAAANAVIKNNNAKYEKKLWSALGEGEPIGVFAASSDRKEAAFVANTILELSKKRGIGFKDVCVFYRTNFQSRVLEDEFISRRIPYTLVGGISFYQRKEIKDILSMLRLLDNPQDLISFLRVINLPKRGFGEASIAKIQEACQASGLAILDFMLKVYQEKNFASLPFTLNSKQKEGWLDFGQSFCLLKQLRQEGSLQDLVRGAIFQTRYLTVLDEDTPTKAERLENLQELVVKAGEWEKNVQAAEAESMEQSTGERETGEQETRERETGEQVASLSKFLEEISLASSADQAGDAENSVTFMTVHTGKGLEFQVAFLVGIEEDLFPHVNCRNNPSQVEEERRLFYVGLTRAKEHLFISYAQQRALWGSVRRMFPSRFLKEIPIHLRKNIATTTSSASRPDMFASPAAPPPSKKEAERPSGSVGEVVFHPQFGVGKIIHAENSSLGLVYDIQFTKDGSTRRLVAKYAPLSRL